MIKGCDASNRQLTSTIFENYLSVGIKSQAVNRTKIESIEILKLSIVNCQLSIANCQSSFQTFVILHSSFVNRRSYVLRGI